MRDSSSSKSPRCEVVEAWKSGVSAISALCVPLLACMRSVCAVQRDGDQGRKFAGSAIDQGRLESLTVQFGVLC